MDAKQVVPGLWAVKIRFVNAYLLDTDDGLALIDTGIPGSAPTIQEALRSIGRNSDDIRHIFVTHCHSDHSGSLAEMKRLTGAPAVMHPVDAAMVREGRTMRPLKPAPGLLNALIYRFMVAGVPTEIERAEIEREAQDGETVPGGLRAIHVPGHCAGQLAFLWPEHGGVLIAADTAANVLGLSLSPAYEDLDEGRRSLSKLTGLEFEVACFGHGKPIPSGASRRFGQEWPAAREASRPVARGG
jgi:glyoxylase-like metal-dependent hydrolase (beta-lactamase superfamily II)